MSLRLQAAPPADTPRHRVLSHQPGGGAVARLACQFSWRGNARSASPVAPRREGRGTWRIVLRPCANFGCESAGPVCRHLRSRFRARRPAGSGSSEFEDSDCPEEGVSLRRRTAIAGQNLWCHCGLSDFGAVESGGFVQGLWLLDACHPAARNIGPSHLSAFSREWPVSLVRDCGDYRLGIPLQHRWDIRFDIETEVFQLILTANVWK